MSKLDFFRPRRAPWNVGRLIGANAPLSIGTRQYARLVSDWAQAIGLDPVGCGIHSLRRTKVALICKNTGNLRACQLLLGHGKLESIVRYLGIEADAALRDF